MEDIPPYDVSLRDGWAICSSEGNHTLTGEPVKNGEQPALLQKRRLLDKYRRISSDRSRCCCIGLGSAGTGFCCRCVSLRERTSERNGVDQGLSNPEKGTVLGAGAQALLFEAGIENIRVWKRPRLRSWRRDTRLRKPARAALPGGIPAMRFIS